MLRYVTKQQPADSAAADSPLAGPGICLSWEQLPEAVQRMLHGPGRRRTQHRTRLGQEHEQQQAWLQQREEERQRREMHTALAAAAMGVTEPPRGAAGSRCAGGGELSHDAGELPPAVQLFLQAAEGVAAEGDPEPAASLAAALADCLAQVQDWQAGRQGGTTLQPASPSSPRTATCHTECGGDDPAGGSSSSNEEAHAASDSNRHSCAELPATQPVLLDEPAAQAAALDPGRASSAQGGGAAPGAVGAPAAGAGCEAGVEAVSEPTQMSAQPTSRKQDCQHDQVQHRGPSPRAANPGTSPSAAEVISAPEVARGTQALSSGIQHAAVALLASQDLEQLRLLLLAVQRLGRQHPWFADGGGAAAVEAAQKGVQAAYGWRLRLAGFT
jgi:hypothetical protein